MIIKPDISLVMLFYNEEKCAQQSCDLFYDYFFKKKLNFELVLVNNGSFDKTKAILENFVKLHKKNSKIVNLKKNIRFGGGIIAGFDNCSGKYMGFTCGDGQVSPEDTFKLIQSIKANSDAIVKGNRVVKMYTKTRFFVSKVYKLFIKSLFKVNNVIDINGYPIFFNSNIYPLLQLNARNWAINVEILYKAALLNKRIIEIPVFYSKRLGGKSHVRFNTIFEFFGDCFKLRYNLFFYNPYT